MDDEDTLDEPEELLEQARNAAAKNQVSDEEPAGVDDETIPAGKSASSLPVGHDDETIDEDPGLRKFGRTRHSVHGLRTGSRSV